MGYFVDEAALYDDVRAAETDEQRGEAIVHHMMADLDSGYEPEQVDTEHYDEAIAPRIEDGLDVDAPDVEILRYENGEQMIYDMMTETISATGLTAFLGRNMDEQFAEEGVFSGIRNRLTAESFGVQGKFFEYLASRVGGASDPWGEHLEGDPSEPETIVYSVPGVKRMAANTDTSYDEMEDYVLTHEAIHAVQNTEYPGLQTERREAVETVLDALTGDTGEALPGVSLEMPSMTMIEGHAEFYTDEIFDREFRNEGKSPSILDVLVNKFLMGDKKAQYEEGKAFVSAIHEAGGNEYVDFAMQHPPQSMDEVRDPHQWAARMKDERAE